MRRTVFRMGSILLRQFLWSAVELYLNRRMQTATIPINNFAVAITPDGIRAYVPTEGEGDVAVIDKGQLTARPRRLSLWETGK
jgi:hypothetical protein